MLTTNQSTRTEQPLQGVLVSKYESKAASDSPEKSSFSKLFSSMQLETTPEASVSISPAEVSALTGEDSAELMAFSQISESESVTLSVIQQLPTLDVASGHAGSNLSAELGLHDSDGRNLRALGVVDVSSNLSAELSLHDSDAPLMAVDEMANPLITPVIDGTDVKADSEVLITSPVVSNQTVNDSELVKDVNDVIVQNIALNQSSVGSEHSASTQLNSGVSNAASNSVTSWGSQASAAVAGVSGGDVQAGTQQNQMVTQGGQGGQNSQGQAGQQQAMMFAQFVKEGKTQAFEQQAAVRSIDESIHKSEGKDLLGGAEIASTDRRGQLPLGLQSIQQPLKHPQWGQALGQRVVFMANNSIQQAQITLNPEKLGQIQVTLQLDKDQKMNVSLNAQNGVTRESMENALPKLREMLEQAGITLGSMDVSDQKQFSDNNADKSTPKGGVSNNAVEEGDAVIESALSPVKITDNIVDYYA